MVAGAGRSGTSTVAGALSMLGLHLPQPEVPADETNPRGFFESQWVVDFHKDLLDRSPVIRTLDARPEVAELAEQRPTEEDAERLVRLARRAARARAGAGQGPARVLVPRPLAAYGGRAGRRAGLPDHAPAPGGGREVARHLVHPRHRRGLPAAPGHRQRRRLVQRRVRHRADHPRRAAGVRALPRPADRLARRTGAGPGRGSAWTSTPTSTPPTTTPSTTSSTAACAGRRPRGTPSTSPTRCARSPRAPGSS